MLVRAHALNELEDVLGLGTEPSHTIPRAMEMIAAEGRGAVLLFREPHPRLDFGEEDQAPKIVKRTGLGSQIMATLGLSELILLTDSPHHALSGDRGLRAVDHRHPPDTRERLRYGRDP